MVRKLEKEFYSLRELATRWGWDESEICALIWQDSLVPSWYFNKYNKYQIFKLEWDHEIDDLTGVPVEGQMGSVDEYTEIFFRQEGYQYLILPKKTSPLTCEFWLFSNISGPFASGDFVRHMTSPISLQDVKERGVVMISEVRRYEEKFKAETIDQVKESQIKPIQRFAAQEAFVLGQLDKFKIDPQKLPKNKPGKDGIKAKIRESTIGNHSLFIGKTVFDKTWERLMANGDISYET